MPESYGLSFFPTPYPEELWYSVLCRYHVRTGNSVSSPTKRDLYNHEVTSTSLFFCSTNCNITINQLPPDTIDKTNIILNHTLFPFVARFASVPIRQKVFNCLLSGENVKATGSILRMWPYKVRTIHLRYCPLCNQESEEEYGEYYWHVAHQIQTMPLCPVHYCRLYSSPQSTILNTPIFIPANKLSCPVATPDFASLPYERLLTDTLYAYWKAPTDFSRNPNFHEFFYNTMVDKGDMPLSTSKIIPDKLSDHILKVVGTDFYNIHFGDTTFQFTIFRMIKSKTFTVPNHYALLSSVLELPPDTFLHDQTEDVPVVKVLQNMAKAPYVYSKLYVAQSVGLKNGHQLNVLAKRLAIEPFWEQLFTKKKHGGNVDCMSDTLKVHLFADERNMIFNRIKQLGIASVSEYLRYCIRLELAQVGLDLPKFPKITPETISRPHPEEHRSETHRRAVNVQRRTPNPDNWDEILDDLRNGRITTGTAREASGFSSSLFYSRLHEEPDAKEIMLRSRKLREVPVPADWEDIVNDYLDGKVTFSEALRRSGLAAGTFNNRLKEYMRRNKIDR